MKVILTSLIALSLAAGLAVHADAANYKKKRHYSGSHSGAYGYRNDRDDDSIGGNYDHELGSVRFGSQRWWYIYGQQAGDRG
jgi:hypothetical protein